jgi:hypothetical protein
MRLRRYESIQDETAEVVTRIRKQKTFQRQVSEELHEMQLDDPEMANRIEWNPTKRFHEIEVTFQKWLPQRTCLGPRISLSYRQTFVEEKMQSAGEGSWGSWGWSLG